MTPAEAMQLSEGDYVASHMDVPAYTRRRITKGPWQSEHDRDVVRVLIQSWSPVNWIDLRHFVRVPKGASDFDTVARRWRRRSTPKEADHGAGIYVYVGLVVPPCAACAQERAA